jgi:hypothetical protein
LATQRITIAKIGGEAADVVWLRLRAWFDARGSDSVTEWSSDQWPPEVRTQVDAFAERMRANSLSLPMLYFVEWLDQWSMGDLFDRWLLPSEGPPLQIHADRFEVYGYALPDGGRLAGLLKRAGPQQIDEYDYFVTRLREAVGAWQALTERATIIVLREPVGGLVTDEELQASLSLVPKWLLET